MSIAPSRRASLFSSDRPSGRSVRVSCSIVTQTSSISGVAEPKQKPVLLDGHSHIHVHHPRGGRRGHVLKRIAEVIAHCSQPLPRRHLRTNLDLWEKRSLCVSSQPVPVPYHPRRLWRRNVFTLQNA